jgi:Beta-propeller repeat
LVILLAILVLFSALPAHAAGGVNPVFGKVDLSFEHNEGQVDPKVKFLARGQGFSLFLTSDEAVMRFSTPQSSVIRATFPGQNKDTRVEGVDPLSRTTNYLSGNGLFQRTGIRSYTRVRYSEVYPGIDLEYHGNAQLLEYDFIVKPGFNPDKIRVAFSGVRGASIDSSGDLILKTDTDSLVQKKPHVYQRIDGREQTIDAAYVVTGNQVGFKIADYDKTQPLVIDPVIIYSTFFGGTGDEVPFGVAVDSQGSAYVTGSTTSVDFPTQSPFQSSNKGGSTDAFVFKLDPSGTQVIYSTYIGGSGLDDAHSIAVDAGGNAYITGLTQSSDFPIVNGVQKTRGGVSDAYVLKLNSSGTAIVFSTYLGGSSDDRGIAIALDPATNIYVTGTTASTNFPTLNPFQRNNAGGFADGFVTKISAAGNLVYSTYVGGVGNDNPLGLAVDENGAAYVTGWTTSVNFPVTNAFQKLFGGQTTPTGTDDVFVVKLNPTGATLDYSTYVGGTGSDEATRIAVDSAGNAYVTGTTSSLDFPVVKPYQTLLSSLTGQDAFIFKLAPDGGSLIFSTYFGGFGTDSGTGIAVDATGAVFVGGYTTSSDLPSANATQNFISGDRDGFVAKFAPVGNVLMFSTFLGGSGTDSVTGLTIDPAGDVYVVGFTNSGDFKLTNAVQPANAGSQDVFLVKLNVQDIVSSSLFQIAPQGASSVITKGTRTDAVFGYAVAEPTIPGNPLTGFALINRQQGGATVSEVGIPVPPPTDIGRLFVDVTTTGRSVLSIANPSDQDATVDFIYTDPTGVTSQFATTTVPAHQHFSRFVTDDPLNIFAPGTLNFTSSIPIIATAFFTDTNESSELLISHTPIVNPVEHTAVVGGKPITIPELAEGGGWKNDIVLVNTTEDRMNGEVRFFSQGNGDQPGAPMEVGIAPDNTPASVVEYDIPPRGFQKVSTAGSATSSETPFALLRGTSLITPGAGAFQNSGWASADSNTADARLNGLAMLEYRQLGITQSQAGIVAPVLRQSGRFFAEIGDNARSFIAIVNPNADDVSVDVFLTDSTGTSTDPVTVTVPANAQYLGLLSDAPISFPANSQRTVNFNASLPVFVTALRFFTNERSDSLVSSTPISDITTTVSQPITIPHFADGLGWKTQVVLVNTSDNELHGEIHFVGQGTLTDPPQGVVVGTDGGDASVFEYDIQPRSFFRLQTNGLMGNLSAGSVQIVPFLGFSTPAAYAVVSNFIIDQAATDAAGETRGNTIFETPIEGQLPSTSLRFYAESNGDFAAGKPRSSRTSIAIANPSGDPATVQLEVTSFDDVRLGVSGPITIPANGQFAAYLQQLPGLEGLPASFQGVIRLSVQSGSGVTASSFRILYNEREDYLVTTTGPLNENAGMPGRVVFPYITDSTGYTTQIVLINPPGVQGGAGVVRYWAADGTPLQIDTLKLGSAQIVPFLGYNTPHAHLVLSHRDSGVLTSIVGVEGEVPGSAFRMYAESIGDFATGAAGSTQTGVALANPADAPVSVTLELRSLDGTLLRTSRPFAVPAIGQLALFLNQVPGFEALTAPYEGVLRVVATSAQGVTATAFRALYNERGNVLYTTTGPLIENASAAQQLVFPHIAEGGGYTTQFIVISGVSGQSNAGVLLFYNEEGNPLNLTLTAR